MLHTCGISVKAPCHPRVLKSPRWCFSSFFYFNFLLYFFKKTTIEAGTRSCPTTAEQLSHLNGARRTGWLEHATLASCQNEKSRVVTPQPNNTPPKKKKKTIFHNLFQNILFKPIFMKWGLREYTIVHVIVHSTLPPSPVILWIELGGKSNWHPLNFGYHDEMCTSPIHQKKKKKTVVLQKEDLPWAASSSSARLAAASAIKR